MAKHKRDIQRLEAVAVVVGAIIVMVVLGYRYFVGS